MVSKDEMLVAKNITPEVRLFISQVLDMLTKTFLDYL